MPALPRAAKCIFRAIANSLPPQRTRLSYWGLAPEVGGVWRPGTTKVAPASLKEGKAVPLTNALLKHLERSGFRQGAISEVERYFD